jgi:O-methyltransferase
MLLEITLGLYQIVSIILVLTFLFLGFKLLEMNWSFRISKPYQWEQAVKEGSVSSSLKSLERTHRDKVRFYTFYLLIDKIKANNIPGAFAELGVYQGETAKIIHQMCPNRPLHLFDTFDGFSKQDLKQEASDTSMKNRPNFTDTSLEEVKKRIAGNQNVQFHPGFFPDTTEQVNESTFAFVHLDADLYAPTLAALNYFYPKLSPGGAIMIHDYNHNWDGLRKAVDEFSETIAEDFAPIADWQGSAVLIRNRSKKS